MRNCKAASPAISMVIITAATVVLVLIAGTFAAQLLDRQQGSSEFETIQKSLVTFDDAVRDVAWDRGGSRSVRFTSNYGYISLLPNEKTLQIEISEYDFARTISTGVVKYSIPTSYVTQGEDYELYILGDGNAAVSSASETSGQLVANQHGSSISYSLSYRVRVMTEGPSAFANYVDILVIKLDCASSTLVGDFDLIARNIGIKTDSSSPFPSGGSIATVNVALDGVQSKPVKVALDPSLPVVFNLITAEVRMTA